MPDDGVTNARADQRRSNSKRALARKRARSFGARGEIFQRRRKGGTRNLTHSSMRTTNSRWSRTGSRVGLFPTERRGKKFDGGAGRFEQPTIDERRKRDALAPEGAVIGAIAFSDKDGKVYIRGVAKSNYADCRVRAGRQRYECREGHYLACSMRAQTDFRLFVRSVKNKLNRVTDPMCNAIIRFAPSAITSIF